MVYAWPVKRAQVERHLVRASGGGLQGAELERAVSAVFDNYGRYWHELFRLQDQSAATIEAHFECEGFEHVEAAHRAGRGTIVALPHLGNYDYAGAWLATQRLSAGRRGRTGRAARAVRAGSSRRGAASGWTSSRSGRTQPGASCGRSRANRVVCLVCDRDLAGDGVAVEFFGERTTLPAGPAALALRTGAALLPVGTYLLPRGGHLGPHPRAARHDPHRLVPRRRRSA